MIAGAVRELYEETGLVARVVKRELMERTFEEGHWRQGIYEVEAVGEEGEVGQPGVVRLDPKEHVAFLWVTEGEVREGKCGSVVLNYPVLEWRDWLLMAFQRHRVGERLKVFGLDGLW